MSLKHLHTAMLAAVLLAGTAAHRRRAVKSAARSEQSRHRQRQQRLDQSADRGEPPTPNGGISSGAHSGNESPTTKGISKNDNNVSEESKKNKERATTGER